MSPLCTVCGTPLPFDTPSSVCSSACLRKGQGFPPLFDVNASVHELDGDGSDGAYSLILRGATPEEVADALRSVLTDGFGLTNAGPCYLALNVGPAGSADKMPL